MTSHCGSGSTVLRAPDRPACRWSRPVNLAAAAGRRGGRMSFAFHGAGDMGPVDGATDTGRGRRPKAFRRLMPRDQAGSMNHPY